MASLFCLFPLGKPDVLKNVVDFQGSAEPGPNRTSVDICGEHLSPRRINQYVRFPNAHATTHRHIQQCSRALVLLGDSLTHDKSRGFIWPLLVNGQGLPGVRNIECGLFPKSRQYFPPHVCRSRSRNYCHTQNSYSQCRPQHQTGPSTRDRRSGLNKSQCPVTDTSRMGSGLKVTKHCVPRTGDTLQEAAGFSLSPQLLCRHNPSQSLNN